MKKFRNSWETVDDSRLRKIMEMQEYYWNEIEPYTSGYNDDRILDMFKKKYGIKITHDIMMEIAYAEITMVNGREILVIGGDRILSFTTPAR